MFIYFANIEKKPENGSFIEKLCEIYWNTD